MLQLYYGITDALLKWVDSIPSLGPQKINNWKERIRKSLDTTEILILIDRWPQLKPLFAIDNEMQHHNVGYQYEGTLLFKFLEASALPQDYPLVVWIDNCHWMEKTSFQWVMSAVHYFSKTSAKHMLFVLTCTTSKPEESKKFWDKDLQDLKSKSSVQLMEISLETWTGKL